MGATGCCRSAAFQPTLPVQTPPEAHHVLEVVMLQKKEKKEKTCLVLGIYLGSLNTILL